MPQFNVRFPVPLVRRTVVRSGVTVGRGGGPSWTDESGAAGHPGQVELSVETPERSLKRWFGLAGVGQNYDLELLNRGQAVLRLEVRRRSFLPVRTRLELRDPAGTLVGTMRPREWSDFGAGRSFDVFDADTTPLGWVGGLRGGGAIEDVRRQLRYQHREESIETTASEERGVVRGVDAERIARVESAEAQDIDSRLFLAHVFSLMPGRDLW